MARIASSNTPFGKNPDGTPYWPSSDPRFIKLRPPVVSKANPSPISRNELRSADQKGETGTIDKMVLFLNAFIPGAKLDPDKIRPMLSSSFAPEPTSIVPAGNSGTRPPTPDSTVQRLRTVYLIDVERHGRCISEGTDDKALEIALKWQTIARLFPDRISEITSNVASLHKVSSFADWINYIVREDWQVARISGNPPQIVSLGQAAPAPSSDVVQVYDNKSSKWVEAGQLIYDAMVEQGSGKYGPSPGLYFRAGGTVGPTP
ncbi:MAG TPA: hypothetical protein PKM25_07400 [Candidatus Ozemobacteraceae bacterium]|nr:hypothetical protein [Candidatus Ozemobacteraceae bacterium]